MPIQRKRKSWAAQRHVTKNKERIFKAVLTAYARGEFTLLSCCESAGISYWTFYEWITKDQDLQKRFDAAKEQASKAYKTDLLEKCKTSFARLVAGEEFDEVTKEAVPGSNGTAVVITKVKTTRVKVQPNPTAVIFGLKNLDPATFKEKQSTEITGADGAALQVAPQTVNFIIPDNHRTKPDPEAKPEEPKA